MSIFGEPAQTTEAARLAALEQRLAAAEQELAATAAALQAALEAEALARQQGVAAVNSGLVAELQARLAHITEVTDQLGAEIQQRAAADQINRDDANVLLARLKAMSGTGVGRAYETWAAASTATGYKDGDGAIVIEADTGTHVDPVLGGAPVKNAGVYRYVAASPSGLMRIANTSSVDAAQFADAAAAAAATVTSNLVSLSTTFTVGRPQGSPAPAPTGQANQGCYVYSNPVAIAGGARGWADLIWVHNATGSAKTIRPGWWSKNGVNFTELSSVSLSAPSGYSEHVVNLPFDSGARLGIAIPTGGLAYASPAVTDEGGYWSLPGTQGTSFTDADGVAVTSVQLFFGARIRQISVTESRVAGIEGIVATHKTAQDEVGASLVATQQMLAASFDVGERSVLARPQISSWNSDPTSNFTRWAIMAAAGVDLPAGRALTSMKVPLKAGTGATHIHLVRSYRTTGSAWLQQAPQVADTPIDTLTFTLAEIGLTVGVEAAARLPLYGQLAPAGRVLVYEIYADDGAGTIKNLGIGRSDPEGKAQYQRGFYKQGVGWTAIATTGALAAEFFSEAFVAEVPVAPSDPAAAPEVSLNPASYPEFSVTGMSVNVTGHLRAGPDVLPIGATLPLAAPDAGKERVDLIVAARSTGIVSSVAGTARTANLDAQEWQGAVPAGSALLGRALVKPTSVSVVSSAMFREFVQLGREGEFAAHVMRNRRCLARTLAKAANGLPGTIGMYGDSITAHQVTKPAVPARYQPNGAWRHRRSDGATGYFDGYPGDSLDKIPLHTAEQLGMTDDLAGTVHTKVALQWAIRDALQVIAGSAFSVFNYSIGGTTTGNTGDNGLSPDRIAVPLAAHHDLVIIGKGMNERGSTATYANACEMIGLFRAAGSEVAVWGCPRPGAGQSRTAWRYTCNALEAAALDAGAAFLSTTMIADDDTIGGMGLPVEMLGALTEIPGAENHPGLFEQNQYKASALAQLGLAWPQNWADWL